MENKFIPDGFILELEKRDEINKETFYRYRFGEMKFWFSQQNDSGNIYKVNVDIEDLPCSILPVRLSDYYPLGFAAEIELKGRWKNTEEFNSYVSQLYKLNYYREQIQDFFIKSWHFDVYTRP